MPYPQDLDRRWIFGLADDLTGALEVGSKFAAQCVPSCVTCRVEADRPTATNFVVDTGTRHLPPERAATVVHAVAARMAQCDPWIVYKKTDSTLRGNIGQELEALAAAFPTREIVYVPAYPAMGRTVRNGQLFVHGVPVHQTAFARDPLNPILDSSVEACLGSVRATILDGESDADLQMAAERISHSSPPPIVAGPAGIAHALAATFGLSGAREQRQPTVRRCLVVNGSLHPASKAQIEYALANESFGNDWTLFQYEGDESGIERAACVGQRVKAILAREPYDAILVFGGDSARGIHEALGSPDFQSIGEVLPGVPVSTAAGLVWITKAGGFGAPDLIEQLRTLLK